MDDNGGTGPSGTLRVARVRSFSESGLNLDGPGGSLLDGSLPPRWARSEMVLALNATDDPVAIGRFSPLEVLGDPSMSTDDPHDLEPIEPRTAQELYLDHKAN